jgi:RNA recognition motif-containing protein
LTKIFGAAGRVMSAAVKQNKSKQFVGTIVMESAEAAQAAVEIFNGADMNGRALSVRLG